MWVGDDDDEAGKEGRREGSALRLREELLAEFVFVRAMGCKEKLSSSPPPIHPPSPSSSPDRQIEPFVRGLLLQGKSPSACNAIRGRPTPHSQNLRSGSLK